MRRKFDSRNSRNLNLDNIKDLALSRATSRTYFAIGLLILSLFAAFAITGQANKSISVWSANKDLVPGDVIKEGSATAVKVLLPMNTGAYLRVDSKITQLVVNRRILKGELLPASALTANIGGESVRSVPLKIARNDLPNDLTPGQSVDIYSLPQEGLNSVKPKETELILMGVMVESLDAKSMDLGGDIGIVLKIPERDVILLLAAVNKSRMVVVRNEI